MSITTVDGGAVSAISFGENGLVNCGSSATSAPVTITNTGGGPLMWSAVVSTMNYMLAPAMGTIDVGQSGTLQIIPNPIPSVSAVTTDLYGGVVTITTNATNDTTHVIQLHQTARGAIITSTLNAMFSFGSVYVQQTASSQFSLTNTGNVSASIALSTGSAAFGVVAPGGGTFPIQLGPNGTVAPEVTFTPNATQSYTDTLVLSLVPPDGGTPTPSCGPLPPNVTLTGSGNDNVMVNPTTLDFGFTNCGATAAPQTLAITANGQGLTFMTALAKGANTPFTVSPTSGSIAAQGTATLTITPKAIPFPSSTMDNGFWGRTHDQHRYPR